MTLITIGLLLGMVVLAWVLGLATLREGDRQETRPIRTSDSGSSRDARNLKLGLTRRHGVTKEIKPYLRQRLSWFMKLMVLTMWPLATPAVGEGPIGPTINEPGRQTAVADQSPMTDKPAPQDLATWPLWHYGGFVDLGYSLNFNFPENHLFRNRGTTPRVNELDLNMAGAYIRKDVSEQSRWGTELLVHGGQDAKDFGFGVNLPKVQGSDALRHFGRANVSYLAPVGKGLTFQAGLFNSFIGYESLYAKDNFNYTRAWTADYSPYLMFGANAQYAFDDQWSAAFFIVNDYFHLQNANSIPSYGAQVAFKPSSSWLFKETVYYGPDQSDTSLRYWRSFSDTVIEWKANEDVTIAWDYQIGTQEMAAPGNPRVFYMGAALPMRWHIAGPWAVAVRPEFYWDRSGLMTGSEQLIRAVTTTAEYRLPYKWTSMIARLEYRYDESTGSGGGFFTQNQVAPGVIGLTPAQHMLIFGLIWTLDSP